MEESKNRFFEDLEEEGHTVVVSISNPHSHKKKKKQKQTFAINSLFLNSPLTNVTFPFLSNSVHRSLNSFVALDTNPRPILKLVSVPSSINAGLDVRLAFAASAALFFLKSNNLRSNGRPFVDNARAPEPRNGENSDNRTNLSLPVPRRGDDDDDDGRGQKQLASTVARHGAGARCVQLLPRRVDEVHHAPRAEHCHGFEVFPRELDDSERRLGEDDELAVK